MTNSSRSCLVSTTTFFLFCENIRFFYVCVHAPEEQREDNVSLKSDTGGILAMCVVQVDKSFSFRLFIKLPRIILFGLLY